MLSLVGRYCPVLGAVFFVMFVVDLLSVLLLLALAFVLYLVLGFVAFYFVRIWPCLRATGHVVTLSWQSTCDFLGILH